MLMLLLSIGGLASHFVIDFLGATENEKQDEDILPSPETTEDLMTESLREVSLDDIDRVDSEIPAAPTIAGDANEELWGDQGDDVLYGNDGYDILHGAAGNDDLHGGDGSDILYGGTGDDDIEGGQGDDTLFGANDVDRVYSSIGNDVLSGGDGDDVLVVFEGDNVISGGNGNDFIYGGRGNDILTGGANDDYIFDTQGDNMIEGGLGNDFINTAHDILFNSSSKTVSASLASTSESGATSYVSGGGGDDVISMGSGVSAHGGNGEDLFLLGSPSDEQGVPVIEDYVVDEDCIVVLLNDYEPDDGPKISVVHKDGIAIVSIDGALLVYIHDATNAVSANDIEVVEAISL